MARSSFLIIQTAFIGDVVLATALVETLHASYPKAKIDFLLRKGNESLLTGHPFLHDVLVWDKKNGKIRNLLGMIRRVRGRRYDFVINLHRFASSGLITAFSRSHTIGFDKNPLSMFFTESKKHDLGAGLHEVQRNQLLIEGVTDAVAANPRLYPSPADVSSVASYKSNPRYICLAPTSVWFTKQYPTEKWIEFLDMVDPAIDVYLLGAPADATACETIVTGTRRTGIKNLAGKLSFLQSAALMSDALMNYVNDSAPMHIASAVQAPVTAVFCSTVPAFGFGPLSPVSHIVELQTPLYCRPCGLHGYKACPQGHFRCAREIVKEQLLSVLHKSPLTNH